MALKRANEDPEDGEQSGPPRKTQKQVKAGSEADNAEKYSEEMRRKVGASGRTGQACDRCRIRKLKCDSEVPNCTSCIQAQLKCQTTDKFSGETYTRGYVRQLEEESQALKKAYEELRTRCLSSGMDLGSDPLPSLLPVQSAKPASRPPLARLPSSVLTLSTPPEPGTKLPPFRAEDLGDNYLGRSSGTSMLSCIRGTSLSVFDTELDYADVMIVEEDDPALPVEINKSYESCFNRMTKESKEIHVELPEWELGLTLVEHYFSAIHPFMPLLHQPTYMPMVHDFYDNPEFEPTPAQTALMHILFAIMFYQGARRQPNAQDYMTRSNEHYHFALQQMPVCFVTPTIWSLQAMAMICCHMRSLPKPGAARIFTHIVLGILCENGLNRSAESWEDMSNNKPNPLEIELRKRIFYGVLVLNISISGKLGRPMPIRAGDFDIEFPEPIDDDLLTEEGYDTSKPAKCKHLVSLHCFKISLIFMDVFSKLYAVKRSKEAKYLMDDIIQLEERFKLWKAQLPADLQIDSATGEETKMGKVMRLWLRMWEQEFQVTIRHPAVLAESPSRFRKAGLQICLTACNEMRNIALELSNYKMLDTNWLGGVVLLQSIFTSLYIYSQMKDTMSDAEFKEVRNSMATWLHVMKETGKILGSGDRLHDKIRSTIRRALKPIDDSIKRRAEQAKAQAAAAEAAEDYERIEPGEKSVNGTTNGMIDSSLTAASAYPSNYSETTKPSIAEGAASMAQVLRSPYPPSSMAYSHTLGGGVSANTFSNVYSVPSLPYTEAPILPQYQASYMLTPEAPPPAQTFPQDVYGAEGTWVTSPFFGQSYQQWATGLGGVDHNLAFDPAQGLIDSGVEEDTAGHVWPYSIGGSDGVGDGFAEVVARIVPVGMTHSWPPGF